VYNEYPLADMVCDLLRTIALLALGLGIAASAAGCVRVHAYQRENLAKRAMVDDKAEGESRFESHARGAREGAEGGTGQPGGGCGCN
jgi:hypothetical protein